MAEFNSGTVILAPNVESLIRWARKVYQSDRGSALRIVAAGWPNLTEGLAEQVLSGEIGLAAALQRAMGPTLYVVGVYEQNQAYGGPEEGGWWFPTGVRRRVLLTTTNEEEAFTVARRANRLLQYWQRDKPGTGSVICDGILAAEVHEDIAPKYYPTSRQRYE